MAALIELKGQDLGKRLVRVERGPVRVFAHACTDDNPAYCEDGGPVPPTFPFVLAYWGSVDQSGPMGLPVEKLRGPGRLILHGEQEFEYHRWPRIGDDLEGHSRISDVYEKTRPNGGSMEFYVTDTDWRDARTDELVCTSRFTLIVNVGARADG
jgi:hypothetical protein